LERREWFLLRFLARRQFILKSYIFWDKGHLDKKLLNADFLVDLLLNPEDAGIIFLRNASWFSMVCAL
jgi:hypothetical protein